MSISLSKTYWVWQSTVLQLSNMIEQSSKISEKYFFLVDFQNYEWQKIINCHFLTINKKFSNIFLNCFIMIFGHFGTILGLTFQVILPLVCYVPVTFMYCWNKYSGDQILISQYTLAFMGTLPCIFDPLLQMYFILPYRKTVQKFIARSPFKPNNAHAVSSIPRRSFLTP
nr:hypothetical protein C01B4.2 - Caenorhabditis elegans [Caenorhabditis elegans]